MLQREGLVISEPNRRVRAAGLSAADAGELYVMRGTLEAVALRITVPELESTGVAELEGLMAQMDHFKRAGDAHGFRTPTARSTPASSTARASASRGRSRSSSTTPSGTASRTGGRRPTCGSRRRGEHRAILDAVAAEEVELAVERLVAHYGRTAALIVAGLGDGHNPHRLHAAISVGRARGRGLARSLIKERPPAPAEPRRCR
jgi:DNA-binding GntR family transcriptional regulator